MIRLSIIIPTFNELNSLYLKENLRQLSQIDDVEVICVDSFSTDGTRELIGTFDITLHSVHTNLRSERLNQGISIANAEMILLHHPRSKVDIKGIIYLRDQGESLSWGGFYHRFDKRSFGLNFTSWYSNYVRSKVCSNIYLDHCIFCKKSILVNQKESVDFIPQVSIFEDTLLSHQLRKQSAAILLPFYSTTSAVRFNKNGFFKQALMNQVLKVMFLWGATHENMNIFYEKNLSLNSKYRY